jgi:hypothetical protein
MGNINEPQSAQINEEQPRKSSINQIVIEDVHVHGDSLNEEQIVQVRRPSTEEEQRPRVLAETYRLPELPGHNEGINGWDEAANDTINNWFEVSKEYRWRYQFVLDRNYYFAAQLNSVSIIFSSFLSIFSGFKLWQTSSDFQNASNIVMLISNTFIAGITTLSKKYIDDSRNEKMRTFIESMDKFIGVIHSQAMVAPIYRIHSSEFIRTNISMYTDMMTTCPNLSLSEYTLAKKKYKEYITKINE